MVMSGMEQMMTAVLLKLGLDPEELKVMALGIQKIAKDSGERLMRLEETQAEIVGRLTYIAKSLEIIISYVEPKPDGGYILGTGEGEDKVVQGILPSEYDKLEAADIGRV